MLPVTKSIAAVAFLSIASLAVAETYCPLVIDPVARLACYDSQPGNKPPRSGSAGRFHDCVAMAAGQLDDMTSDARVIAQAAVERCMPPHPGCDDACAAIAKRDLTDRVLPEILEARAAARRLIAPR